MSSIKSEPYTLFPFCLGGGVVTKLERDYQMYLIPEILKVLPGRKLVDKFVIINDANQVQGIPDLSVFCRSKWAMLEVKLSEKSKIQPNQEWYITNWGQFIFTAFIYPENEKEVLLALQQSLGS